ncbi:MAG: hypothetical protein ABIQ88_03340 [Chitinophagaceae bacterium]
MKALRKYMVLVCFFTCAHAGAQEAVALSHYVLDGFVKGRVQQKNGSMDAAMLNYNVLSGEIIFESAPGQYLALANPEKVDTVFIQDRKFIPVNDKFFEVLTMVAYPLLLEYTCTVKEPGSDVGYGMTSVTTASTAVKALIQGGGAYSLHLPDGYRIIPGYNYWLYKDGKYQKANNAKQMIVALPEKRESINEWVKTNNTNFTKRGDITELVKHI